MYKNTIIEQSHFEESRKKRNIDRKMIINEFKSELSAIGKQYNMVLINEGNTERIWEKYITLLKEQSKKIQELFPDADKVLEEYAACLPEINMYGEYKENLPDIPDAAFRIIIPDFLRIVSEVSSCPCDELAKKNMDTFYWCIWDQINYNYKKYHNIEPDEEAALGEISSTDLFMMNKIDLLKNLSKCVMKAASLLDLNPQNFVNNNETIWYLLRQLEHTERLD